MSDTPLLRLRPPTRTADAALGERLAELARVSTPTTARLRTRRWAAPVAGVALLVASGGVAWGTHADAHHTRHPIVVPGVRLAPAPSPEQAVLDARTVTAPARGEQPTSPPSVAGRRAPVHEAAGEHRSRTDDAAGRGPEPGDLSDSSDNGDASDEAPAASRNADPTADTAHDAAPQPTAGGTGTTSDCADPSSSCD